MSAICTTVDQGYMLLQNHKNDKGKKINEHTFCPLTFKELNHNNIHVDIPLPKVDASNSISQKDQALNLQLKNLKAGHQCWARNSNNKPLQIFQKMTESIEANINKVGFHVSVNCDTAILILALNQNTLYINTEKHISHNGEAHLSLKLSNIC